MLRFCIVGAGFIGGVHAQALREIPLAKVTVICDHDCDRASVLASKTGAVCVPDHREAVLREDVDVVCICTPSGRHAEVAIAAARAGKHLVVEKPLEINLERIDRMLEAAAGAGVQLTCIFPLRFMGGVEIARAALQDGRLGKLVLADAIIKWYRSQAYYDQGGWKGTWELDGGGALMNQGIHTIDLLYHLAGPVTRVCGRIATLAHRMETEDTAVAVIQFKSGALGVIEGSTAAWPGESGRVELHGERGSLRLEEGRITAWKLADTSAEEAEAILQTESGQGSGAEAATAIGHELHRRQLADFIGAIQERRPPKISGEEARHSVAIIRAVYEASARESWVDVDA